MKLSCPPTADTKEEISGYLNEFVFRFNRWTSVHRGKLFSRLAQQAVAVEPVPYANLVKGVREGRYRKYNVLG